MKKILTAFFLSVALMFAGLLCLNVNAADVVYELVSDVSNLAVGDTIIIVDSNKTVALSTNQKKNNRGEVKVELDEGRVVSNSSIQEIVLENGTKAGTFAFNVGTGYLYAASNANNYLRTQSKLDDNGSWKITIEADGVATIKAQGDNTHNWLRYNSSSSLFSCYLSGQDNVSIMKKVEASEDPSKNYYEVTFIYGNEIDNYVSRVEEGTTVTSAPKKIVNFKEFGGWYKDEALTQAWDFENDTVVKNTTLYAKWVDLNVNTLAEACEMPNGNTVVVIAKVTVSKGNSNHFIQDSTGALILYDSSNAYEIGSVYKIYGTLTTYSGAKEIKDVVACEKVAQDIVISPLTSPSDITEANLSKYIELTNYEVPSKKAFEFYGKDTFTKGDIAALENVGSIINVKGVVSTFSGKMQITVSEVEALPSFVTTDTKSSLIVTYDEELKPTDVDLRLGGIITTDSYLESATYGVLVTTGTVNLTAGKTAYATVAEFLSANKDFKNVTCTPARVNKSGVEDINGDYYQFAWVITDMEGHYDTTLTAVMYMVYDGALYICNSKTTSVKATAQQYITDAATLGLTEDQVTVLGKLVD